MNQQMMSEMMKQCFNKGEKPDTEQMKKLMENCGCCSPGMFGAQDAQGEKKEPSKKEGASDE